MRLRAKVRDVMITGSEMPQVTAGLPLEKAIAEMDEKNKGFVLVTNGKNRLVGILTDGDLRRMIRKGVIYATCTKAIAVAEWVC